MAFRHHHPLFFALTILFTALTVSARSFPNIPSTQKHKPWEAFYNFTKYQPGQKYKGLSDVKNYFHKFGYIPNANPLSNFTDDFDDTLVSAIQAYQNNYNLNVTGKLDETTSATSRSLDAAFPTRLTSGKRTSRRRRLATIRLNSDYKAAFARAFNRWTPVVKIKFEETASYQTANITIAFLRGDHGDGIPFDGPATGFSNNVLAHAFSPTNGMFHLDADEVWGVR
ncbi:PGBD-like superfamily [Sesbania bispinosa]|nr:PGBD-like superfamily [Sesbania bispinosa]